MNCDLTDSGALRRRDSLVPHAELPPGTIGLYSFGGKLRVAVPAGHGIQNALPADFAGDVFGDAADGATSLTRYVRLNSFTTWGASPLRGALPYLCLRTDADENIHHYLLTAPTSPTEPIKTTVSTGFLSGRDILKIKQKVFAVDIAQGVIRASSTEFGPGVWSEDDAPNDAGTLAVNEHALAGAEVSGLTLHQGKLVVVYDNAMQFWDVDPDLARCVFNFALNGPGTRVFGSLTPVIGDVFYFSDGGFQSLMTQTQTGELREQSFGAPVRELTKRFRAADPDDVISWWSQARSQYLCVFNEEDSCEVYAYKWVPSFGISGFTRWVLPLRIDYITELEGILYVRSGDMVYRFDPDTTDDFVDGVATTVDAYYDTQFVDGGAPGISKQWLTIDVTGDAVVDLLALVDRRNRTLTVPVAFNLNGSTAELGTIPFDFQLHAAAVRVTFKSHGTVELLQLTAIPLSG
jgi:hypothetical protein